MLDEIGELIRRADALPAENSQLPEHLILRCRCGDWIDFAKHDGAVYKPRVLCCRQEAFTRFLYDHGLECATADGLWLTVEPWTEALAAGEAEVAR